MDVMTFFALDGRRRFQADGPYPVEADDTNEALLEAVPRPRWGMLFSRPALAEDGGIQLAIAVATPVARAHRGAVYDPQAERLLFPHSPTGARPTLTTMVRLVKLTWLVAQHQALRDIAMTSLGLVRQHFPAGLPRRYGATEPMQHRLLRDGDDDFYRLWDTVNQDPVLPSIYFKSAPPCYGGHVWLPGPSPSKSRPITIEMDSMGACWRRRTARGRPAWSYLRPSPIRFRVSTRPAMSRGTGR